MQRQIRSELTEKAEIASVEVFAANLRKLLLTPPVRGKTVLAIDPGVQQRFDYFNLKCFVSEKHIGSNTRQAYKLLINIRVPMLG